MSDIRTVEYQGMQTQGNAYISVPDNTAALRSVDDYNNRQLARGQEALEGRQALTRRNAEMLDEAELNKQRAAIAQNSSRNELVLQAQRIQGQQGLEAQKLSDGFALDIQRLQMTQKAARDEMRLNIQKFEHESLTQFGAQLVQFSQSLWKRKAADINKANKELEAQGMMDELLGMGTTSLEDLYRVDQQQRTSLLRQAEGQLVANQLDTEGRPNEATNVRANNPYYLYGRREGASLKAATELPEYLEKVVFEAEQGGVINKGDVNADMKLQMILNTAARNFLIDKGLTSIPPAVMAKYFGDALIKSTAGISKRWNAENREYVERGQQSVAIGQLNIGADAIAADPAEASKHVDQIITSFGGDFQRGLGQAFAALTKHAHLTGNRRALDNFMQDPRNSFLLGEYSDFQRQFQERAASAAEKQATQLKDGIWGSFMSEASGLTNGNELNALKSRWAAQADALPVDLAGPLKMQIAKFQMSDLPAAQQSLDTIRLNTPVEQLPAALTRFAQENPGLPPNLRDAALKEAKQLTDTFSKNPEIQQLLTEAKLSIRNLLDPKAKARRLADGAYGQKEAAVIKRREEELERRFKVWITRPGATPDSFREWLQSSNKDLLGNPITDNGTGVFRELVANIAPRPSSSVLPSLPEITIPSTKRKVVSYLAPTARAKVIDGSYGRLNGEKSLLLAPQEIGSYTQQYESGQGVHPTLLGLAAKAGVTPQNLLRSQARLWGMGGDLQEPPAMTTPDATRAQSGGKVSVSLVRQLALQNGFSPRGSVWLANSMSNESGGDPNAIHDGGTGLGLFGHRLDRREAMIQFAKARGVPPSDGYTQTLFAIHEIKTHYPGIWDVVSAPNPTKNELWNALVDWSRFNKRVYATRQKSLFNALGEN